MGFSVCFYIAPQSQILVKNLCLHFCSFSVVHDQFIAWTRWHNSQTKASHMEMLGV